MALPSLASAWITALTNTAGPVDDGGSIRS